MYGKWTRDKIVSVRVNSNLYNMINTYLACTKRGYGTTITPWENEKGTYGDKYSIADILEIAMCEIIMTRISPYCDEPVSIRMTNDGSVKTNTDAYYYGSGRVLYPPKPPLL